MSEFRWVSEDRRFYHTPPAKQVVLTMILEFSNLDDNDEDEENKKKFKARQREWIAKNFTVEGDYRPERLYAKMSAARWNELEFHGSSFVVEGVPELWEEWKKEKANRTTAAAFEKIIKTTWMDRAAEGLSAIGTRFNFDGAKAKPGKRSGLTKKEVR